MKKAVIYARFSSHSQNEQSIEGQLKTCFEFAEQNGYKIINEYIDRAVSGTGAENRPEFQRMISDSSKRQFQSVLVYQLDRFARNRYDSATYKAKLKKNGVKVVSARENISDDASGVLMEAVLEGMAEYYSVELAQKVKRGMDLNAEKGFSNGGRVPLGFKTVPIDPADKDSKKMFAIDEPNAEVVRQIFTMYASGSSVKSICASLNNLHKKTSFGVDFNKNSLALLLQNERYIGVYKYKGERMQGSVPRIISDELFFQVQDIMNKNKKAPARARAKIEYLLTTKLYCGLCQSMMIGVSGTSRNGVVHSYYTCNGRKCGCKKSNVKKNYIEDLVINIARKQLTNENIDIIANEVLKICASEKVNSDVMRVKGLLRDNSKAIDNLLDAIEKGKAVEIIYQRLEQKQKEQADLEKELALVSMSYDDVSALDIRFFLTQMRNASVDDETIRKILITVLINKIILYDDKITVILNATGKPVEVTEGLIDDIEKDVFVYESSRSTIRTQMTTLSSKE